jgi:hypothetical protein
VFEGLGHLIHLIQDMAVPAHTRNDAHPLDDTGIVPALEHWARRNEAKISSFAEISILPTLFLDASVNNLSPITTFWDTDQYDGTAAMLELTRGTTVGLSEYTNANFFSDDTINSPFERHQFPFPSNNLSDYYTCEDDAPENSVALRRLYLSRMPCTPGPIDHFLAIGVLENSQSDPAQLVLDPRVHEDYAKQLIPRAVGYSAGLINYFFRGQLAVEPVDQNHVRIHNFSSEPLNSGTVELFYDTPQDERVPLTAPYIISSPIGSGQTTQLLPFTPPINNKTPGRYWAVFSGTLGAEDNAVIGSFGLYWAEEWDQGLTGRHSWYQTTNDLRARRPSGSTISAEVSGGVLTQVNARAAGTTQNNENSQVNQSFIGIDTDPTTPDPYRDAFPILVTPQTELRVKVDLINVDFLAPLPQCIYSLLNGAYQHVSVNFDRILAQGAPSIEFTVPGQQFNAADSFSPVFIAPGAETRINVYQELRRRNILFNEPLQIASITITQQFLPPCETTAQEQRQELQVDYIRIIDMPNTP